MSEYIKTFTDDNFEHEVLKSEEPVLVDFWATWCSPCIALAPIIEDLAKEYQSRVKVGKMNVDDNPFVPNKYMINSIPALFLFINGEIRAQLIGFKPKSELIKFLNNNLPPLQ